MSIDSIISNNLLNTGTSAASNTLGKDDFLQLMITQMQNQDPLDPMDNQDMLAQMAQFSSLEQMANLNTNFLSSQSSGDFLNATHLLGKTVHVLDPTKTDGSTISQNVQSVSYSSSGPILSLDNGQSIDFSQIIKVEEPTSES